MVPVLLSLWLLLVPFCVFLLEFRGKEGGLTVSLFSSFLLVRLDLLSQLLMLFLEILLLAFEIDDLLDQDVIIFFLTRELNREVPPLSLQFLVPMIKLLGHVCHQLQRLCQRLLFLIRIHIPLHLLQLVGHQLIAILGEVGIKFAP